MKRTLTILSLLSALSFSACASPKQGPVGDMADLASPSEPSLYCRQFIAAVASGQESRAVALFSRIGEGPLTEERRKGIALAAHALISLSQGVSGGPMTEMTFHQDQTFPRGISHLTVESWQNADGKQVFYSCIVTPEVNVHIDMATDEGDLKARIAKYYKDFIDSRRNADAPSI